MSEYIFLIIIILLPWTFLYIHHKYFKTKSRLLFLAFSGLGIYFIILLGAHLTRIDLQSQLDAFDLNGDGFFSGHEITPALEEAVQRATSDTGSALAPITGAIFSVIYVFIVSELWALTEWAFSKLRKKRI